MKNKKLVIMISITALAIIGIYFISASREPAPDVAPADLPGLQTGLVPWETGAATLKARLEAIGLPALKEEGVVLHTHQHLDIYIDGELQPLPPEIGINEDEGFISHVHTHEPDSIIHVESPTIKIFTLGQFFDVWGVRFDDECLGGYCREGDKSLRLYVNGREIAKDFRAVRLGERQEIVLAYGAASDLPSPIPASFNFPRGY